MDQKEIHKTAQTQLAIDLNCTVNDLNSKKDQFIFVEAKANSGRRPFPIREHHFEMLSMGNAVVVSAAPRILQLVKPMLDGKGRDDAFCMPFVCGQSLYFLPDLKRLTEFVVPAGFACELVEQTEIPQLYKLEGFHNALGYDVNHPRPDVLAAIARDSGRIIGIAGASFDCAGMWQIGIDVLPEYRQNGLAAYLVNVLTRETLNRGFVPYYGTSSSNILSQRTAHRAGYYPAWICSCRGNFEGCLPQSEK